MNRQKINCSSCNAKMELAFCAKASGLSYVKPDQFMNKIFLDKDLSKSGLRKLIPWKGEWHRAHICESCAIYTIEYGVSYSRDEVEKLILTSKK